MACVCSLLRLAPGALLTRTTRRSWRPTLSCCFQYTILKCSVLHLLLLLLLLLVLLLLPYFGLLSFFWECSLYFDLVSCAFDFLLLLLLLLS